MRTTACLHTSLLFLALGAGLFACRKSVADLPPGTKDSTQVSLIIPDTTSKPRAPYPQNASSGCSYAPLYGDSIVYPQPSSGKDYIISPTNNPGTGKYFSWPIGMNIDSLTGAINISRSQTGQKYAIGFVKSGTRDTCLNALTIGGAGYIDSVYVLSQGATTAAPYFDANPATPSPCKNGQGNGSGCAFDIYSGAAFQHVIVDDNTGIIDLNKTLNGKSNSIGAFGLVPFNGETIYSTIFYKVHDESNNALQYITLKLIYYNHQSDVPAGLRATIGMSINNLLNGSLLSTDTNPKPPLIVIVRSK